MYRHRLAPIVALTAALVLIVVCPVPAMSAGVATFRLFNTDPAGSEPVSSVLARIKPPSAVVPRDVETDPPTILPESTGFVSSGFDQEALELGLIDGTTDEGDPFQILRLDFGDGGFGPGARLYFQLNKATDFTGDIELLLPDSVTNLAIAALELEPPVAEVPKGGAATPPAIPPPPTTTQVPEPVSVLLWATLALGIGLVRVHAYRRGGTARPATA